MKKVVVSMNSPIKVKVRKARGYRREGGRGEGGRITIQPLLMSIPQTNTK